MICGGGSEVREIALAAGAGVSREDTSWGSSPFVTYFSDTLSRRVSSYGAPSSNPYAPVDRVRHGIVKSERTRWVQTQRDASVVLIIRLNRNLCGFDSHRRFVLSDTFLYLCGGTADTLVLEASDFGRVGSNPTRGTNLGHTQR